MTERSDEFDSLFGGTVVVFVGFVVQLGLVFLLRVSIARYLSVEAFGLVALFIAMINTAGLFSVAGLDVGIGRYLPRFDAGTQARADVLRSAIEVALPLSVGAAVVVYLASGWLAAELFHDPTLRSLFVVAAIATPFFGLQRLALGAAQGQERTLPKVLIENLLVPVSQLAFTVLVVLLGYRTLGIAWAYAGGFILSGAFGVVYLLKRTPLRLGRRGSMHRRLAAFSAPLIVTGIMFHLIHYLDTFLLGSLDTAASVGIYNTVYPLSQLTTVFLGSFGFLLLPAISGFDVDDQMDEAARIVKLTVKWILFLTFPVFMLMFYFPELTISLTFGEKYASGALALSVLVFGFLVHSGLGSTGKALIATGHTRLVMVDNIVAALVNVVLNVYLIPRYGFLGAAVASVIAFWTMDALFLYQLDRYVGIVPFSRGLVQVAVISLPATAVICGVVGRSVDGSIWGVLPVFLFAALVHLLVVIRYGDLSTEELAVVSRAERQLGRDLSPVRRTIQLIRQ